MLNEPEEVIWETMDRLGRRVVLTVKGWAHATDEHTDLVDRSWEVREAIELADEVVRDRKYAHRLVHYRTSIPGRRWLRVVVHYRPRNPSGWIGEVITAHFISRRYHREAHLWPSRNRR